MKLRSNGALYRHASYLMMMGLVGLLITLTACSPAPSSPIATPTRVSPDTRTPTAIPADTATPVASLPGRASLTPAPSDAAASGSLQINFDHLPAGVPPEWNILYAPFEAAGEPPQVIQAQVQDNGFMIENLGTYSGLYALYAAELPTADLQIDVDTQPGGQPPMGVFLVCRYSEAGWYQFRVSNGGTSIQLVKAQGAVFNAGILAEGPGVFLDDGVHRLTGICAQHTLTLLIDGREILSKEADFLPAGTIGFGVESFSTPGGRKVFDNVEIRSLALAAAGAPSPVATQVAALPATATATLPPIPAVTPTLTFAPTARPTRIPEAERGLYSTEFDPEDASLADWKTFAYSFASQAIGTDGFAAVASGGYYRIKTTEINQRVFSIYDVDLGTVDVDLSMKVIPPDRVTQRQQQAGLVCRYSEAGWYQFMMEPNDKWSIRLAKLDSAGQPQFYKLSEGLSYFSRGFQELEIRAECKGDRLTFYVNGEKLASLHEATLPAGKVGLAGWSFTQPGLVALVDNFKVQRAEWSDSTATGPAPTPAADGAIYATQFQDLATLSSHWNMSDAGVIRVPGTSHLYGGPGDAASPHTLRYINDFDPGSDVEISAEVKSASLARGLICRYSEDGWYQTHYETGLVVLVREERNQLGLLRDVILQAQTVSAGSRITLTLTCAGNHILVSINGVQTLAVDDNTWSSGRYGLMFLSNSLPADVRAAFTRYTVRPAQPFGSTATGTAALPNQAMIPAFEPGAEIYGIDFPQQELRRYDRLNDPLWQLASAHGDVQFQPGPDGVYLKNSSLGGLFVGLYTQDLGTWPVEVSAETVFTDTAGSVSVVCRFNAAGSYEFSIQPKGKWAITRNSPPDYDYQKPGVVLAQGTSAAIKPDRNQIAAACQGRDLVFQVNGEELGRAQDDMLVDGKVGIGVGQYGAGSFANFSVRRLK